MAGRPPIKTINGYDLGEVVSAFQKSIRRGEEYNALYFAAEMYKSGYKNYPWKRLFVIVSEDIGIAAPNLQPLVWSLFQQAEWFKKQNKSDDHDALFLCHAIIAACRADKCRMNDHAACLFFYSSTPLPHLEVPDYALDMHTRRGRSKGRGVEHFWSEAGKLENEAEIDDPYEELYKKSWIEHERNGGKVPQVEQRSDEPNKLNELFDTAEFKKSW